MESLLRIGGVAMRQFSQPTQQRCSYFIRPVYKAAQKRINKMVWMTDIDPSLSHSKTQSLCSTLASMKQGLAGSYKLFFFMTFPLPLSLSDITTLWSVFPLSLYLLVLSLPSPPCFTDLIPIRLSGLRLEAKSGKQTTPSAHLLQRTWHAHTHKAGSVVSVQSAAVHRCECVRV